jgi:N-acetylmuramoyl-L-alanine amidase
VTCNARPRHALGRLTVTLLAVVALAPVGRGQSPGPRPSTAFTVISPGQRSTLVTAVVNGREVVALDDLAQGFELTVREDALAGGLTLAARGRTLVLSTSQGLASAGGRLVSLSGPPVRLGRSWAVPLDTIDRALPLLLDLPIELRRDSRLIVAGEARVPRVAVRVETQPAPVRVLIDIAPATPHVVEQTAGRLVVRFEADALDASLAPLPQTEVLAGIRLLEPGTALAVELGPSFSAYRASDAPAERGSGARLTIDLLTSAPSALPSPATPTPAPPPTTAGPVAPEPPPLFEPPSSALRTVVVDPGHGGEEEGARGPGGTLEKNVALAVARQLRALLETRMGVRVLLTRDADQTVTLDQRAAQANSNKADLFVSLHANASVRPAARGAEVFYLSADEYNAEARQAAAIEGELLPTVSGVERRVEMILWDMAQLQHLEDSAVLARLVEEELRGRVPMSTLAIQQAPFRVLVGANMPAVLVEMGFLTNPDEEKLLGSAGHQAALALAVYDGLARFRSYLDGGRRGPAAADVGPLVPASTPPAPPAPTSRPGAR